MSPMLCACQCGQPAPIAVQTDRLRGYVKGEPLRFVHGHHSRLRRRRDVPEPQDQPAASAPPVTPRIGPVPDGVSLAVHQRFWAIVFRACEEARAELPATVVQPDTEDPEDGTAISTPDI
jgi:hypothetical protein